MPAESTFKLHRGADEAVRLAWNNGYEEAESILSSKKTTNPRFALEYALTLSIKSFLRSSNEQREMLLDQFKVADGLAVSARSGQPMVASDSSSEEDEAIAESAAADHVDVTTEERERIAKNKQKAAASCQGSTDAGGEKAIAVAAPEGASKEEWQLECDMVYADALMCRALCQLTMNSYLRGGINLRKAWGCYYSLLQQAEKDIAANKPVPREILMNIKFGCGTFFAYLALVPAGLMKLLSAIGFISDKELGEQYLTEVFQSDTIRSPLAALVLCTYYLFLPTGLGNVHETLAKAKVVLDAMNSRYPDNTHFHAYTNFYHRKKGETREALEAILRATTHAERGGVVPMLLQYLHADTLLMNLDFEGAKLQYESIVNALTKSKETFAYSGQVVLSLAACYVMLGNEAAALAQVRNVEKMYNPKSKNDANSPKFAARVLAEPRLLPMLAVYILYVNRDLAHMKEDHAHRLLGALAAAVEGKDMSPPEVAAMHALFVGVIHKGIGDKETALKEWEKATSLERRLKSDSMVLPYVYYEMGELEYRRGDLQKAKQYFEKGQSFKGDGHETLSNRYSIAMKQLRRAIEASGQAKS